jgi:hypothetical protein
MRQWGKTATRSSRNPVFEKLADYFNAKEREWEAACIRCGGCCGAFDDPCIHLCAGPQGKYFCNIYENRFGTRVSIKGERFTCVHITQLIDTHWKNDHLCAYKRHPHK